VGNAPPGWVELGFTKAFFAQMCVVVKSGDTKLNLPERTAAEVTSLFSGDSTITLVGSNDTDSDGLADDWERCGSHLGLEKSMSLEFRIHPEGSR
jgi:hypothetical protein